jgi:hypothetical protein
MTLESKTALAGELDGFAFLAGTDACYVTGQTLNVSGGSSMW